MYSISKKRFVYLDFIKALSIYLVCFYHYNNFNTDFLSNPSVSTYLSYFIKGIASTGVPLFLMVNGAIMLNNGYNQKRHIKKTINLILLTIVWVAVKALYSGKLEGVNHLWFLQALIGIYILFPLIKRAYDAEDRRVVNCFLMAVFIFIFAITLFNIIANFFEFIFDINYIKGSEFNLFANFCAYSLMYFVAGGLLLERLKYNVMIDVEEIVLFFVIGVCILFLYSAMMSVSNKEVYVSVWCGFDGAMTLLMSVSIFVLLYISRNQLDRFSSIIRLLGKNALGIYFVGGVVGYVLNLFYAKLPFSASILCNLVFCGVVVVISLIIVLLLRKVPFVGGLFRM